MYEFLLDTNIISDLVRHPDGRVTQRLERLADQAACTSIIVAAELRFATAKRGSPRLAAQLEAILGSLDTLPLEAPADEVYARLRADLERSGRPIGGNDLLIAAHAVTLGLMLVTDNEREFARIPGLRTENWLR